MSMKRSRCVCRWILWRLERISMLINSREVGCCAIMRCSATALSGELFFTPVEVRFRGL